jgi:hypothetical protein
MKSMSESANSDRRRLLRASAAAPLIVSLSPSSAFAMSSATACVLRPGVDDPGTAVRVEVTRLEKRPPPAACEDGTLPPPAICECDGPDLLFRYLDKYYVETDVDTWGLFNDFVNEDCYEASASTAVAAFDVDSDGVPVSVLGPLPANTKTGSAISHSCLTSLIYNGIQDPR